MVDLVKHEKITQENDHLVITACFEELKGGVVLNVDNWKDEIIPAGHIVVAKKDTTLGGYKEYKLARLEHDNLISSANGEGFTPIGIVKATALKKKPFVSVMIRGSVNTNLLKYKLGGDANHLRVTELVSYLPFIHFQDL